MKETLIILKYKLRCLYHILQLIVKFLLSLNTFFSIGNKLQYNLSSNIFLNILELRTVWSSNVHNVLILYVNDILYVFNILCLLSFQYSLLILKIVLVSSTWRPGKIKYYYNLLWRFIRQSVNNTILYVITAWRK